MVCSKSEPEGITMAGESELLIEDLQDENGAGAFLHGERGMKHISSIT
jgi:hypothetical protein